MKSFNNIFHGKILILGVGNLLRSDDGVGPLIIERLKGNVDAECYDAANAPENYAGKIIRQNPDTILIIDAVHMELNPGEFQLFDASEIKKSGFTTHDLSPTMFIDYIKNESNAKIYMLGIQPKNIDFGDEISGEMEKAIEEICRLIIRELPKK